MKDFLSYGKQWIDTDDIQAVVDVLKSDYLTQGPKVEEFENAIHLFQNSQWQEALAVFEAVIEKYNDFASKYYINIIHNIINGLEENHDGTLIIN